MPQKKVAPPTYTQRLLGQMALLENDYVAVLEASQIQYVNPNRRDSGIFLIGAHDWGWAPSGPELEAQRMDLLGRLRDWEPRFRLLFPHPTPEVATKLTDSFKHLERWLVREGTRDDWSVPKEIPTAVDKLRASVKQLRGLTGLLPSDPWPVRLVVDTNALLDNPDL
ncbi:MAG TPA: hypothetical protein VGE95_04735, partial [Arthrobacter sp.]